MQQEAGDRVDTFLECLELQLQLVHSSIETFKHFVIGRKPASDGLHNIDACPDVDRRESDGSVGSCESPSALASAHDSKRIKSKSNSRG